MVWHKLQDGTRGQVAVQFRYPEKHETNRFGELTHVRAGKEKGFKAKVLDGSVIQAEMYQGFYHPDLPGQECGFEEFKDFLEGFVLNNTTYHWFEFDLVVKQKRL